MTRRRWATAAGCLLVAAGVLLLRLSERVAAYPKIRRFLLHSGSGSVFFQDYPATFAAAVAAIAAGCLALFLALPPRPERDEVERPGLWPSLGRVGWLALTAFPALTLGLFALAQWKGFHNHWSMVPVFAALVSIPLLLLAARDRRAGVRMGPRLTRIELVALAAASLALLALYARGLDSWKFSFIGDEWSFFWSAEELAREGLLKVQWLEAKGVSNFFPVAITGWQALFMRWLGLTNFAWRLSMSAMIVVCLTPLYLTLRHFLARVSPAPRIAASVGCAFFFLSEFIVVWSRIGKPHAGFIPCLVFASCLFFAARARCSWSLYFLAGLVSGLGCFLSSLSPLPPMAVISGLLVFESLASPERRRRLGVTLVAPLGLLAAGFLIGAAPNLVELDYWRRQVAVNMASAEAQRGRALLWPRTLQTCLSFLTYQANSHFLWRNAIDPITAFFAAAAFGMGRVIGLRRWVFLAWCLFAVGLLAGGLAQYRYPPPTRLMLMMFPVALLAATGFAVLTRSSARLAVAAALVVIPLVGACNLLKLETWNPYQHGVEFPMHVLRRLEESPPDRLFILILPDEQRSFMEGILLGYPKKRRIRLLEGGPERLRRLSELLSRDPSRLEVDVWDLPETPAIEEIVRRAGARFEPLAAAGIPQPPSELPRMWFYRLFDETNSFEP
jgi:hypothetical protein